MNELQRRAKARLARDKRARRTPRFRRAIGRLVAAKLLETNVAVDVHRKPVPLGDFLWAGQHEPRILELLPAIVVKRPSLLAKPIELPDDLKEVTRAIRHGVDYPVFREVPPHKYLHWIDKVGHRGRTPSLVKNFRLRREDVARLRRLKEILPAKSETDVIRLALQTLEKVAAG